MRDAIRLLPLLTLMAPAQVSADELPVAACPPGPVAVPPELAPWQRPHRAITVGNPAPPSLAMGVPADATLLPAGEVRYPVAPGKVGDAQSFGGVFAFDVTVAGRYRVALGAGAWIDVIEDGKPLASTAHSRGPACSGIRKMVDFTLMRGRHLLELSDGAQAATGIMIVALR